MKLHLLIAVQFASFMGLAQPLISWGPEIQVSDGSIYGNYRPRATVLDDNSVVVIYGAAGSTENLFISKWNGSSFNTPISILPAGISSYINSWTGPDIASKGDTIIAVFKHESIDLGKVYSVRSTDGGLTFSDTIRVDNHENGVAWMPSMDIDVNGNPVVTYMAHDGGWNNPHYVIANSPDAGLTYNPELIIPSTINGEACDCCPAEMVVKNQKQVLLYRNNDNNVRDIHGMLSTDNGISFPSQANIDNINWAINGCPSTGPSGIIIGDTLYTTYASAGEGFYRVYLSASSITSNLNFLSRTNVAEPTLANDTQNKPRISGENDTIVLVWEENISGNKEIFCSVAIPGLDAVSSLTSFKSVANATTAGIQANPEVIYKNGLVHLFFQDNSSGELIYRQGTINVSLGVEEIVENNSTFPNPSETGEFILTDAKELLNVISSSGEKITFFVTKNDNDVKLTLDQPSSGIYFLTYLSVQNEEKVLKLIKN